MGAASRPVTGRRLHVTADYHDRDLDAAEAAANAFLTALGIDVDQAALVETPARMARAYAELLTPREFDLTTFDNDEGYEQLVLVQGIPFRSLCEHHALPFIGTADVGYLPGKRIIGLSKLGPGLSGGRRRPVRAPWTVLRGSEISLRSPHCCKLR